jgi:integrase/recombinase XerD
MKSNVFSYRLSCYLTQYLPGIAGLSNNTIMSYRDMFVTLIEFYETRLGIKPEKIDLSNFSSVNIVKYLEWLEKERRNSTATRNVRLAAIHAFARYLERHVPESIHTMLVVLSIPYKKHNSKTPMFLNADTIKILLATPDISTKTGRRDRVLLSLLYDSGARVQEVCDLTVSDIRLDESGIVKLTGKGDKTRIVPLMKSMVVLLKQYIDENGLQNSAYNSYPLFQNRSGTKFTRKGISYILSKYVAIARNQHPDTFTEKISPHCFRHSKSMHLLQSGVNLVYIRDILGHVDIKTTEVYARIDSEMKRKALEKASMGTVSEKAPLWQENKNLINWLKELGH